MVDPNYVGQVLLALAVALTALATRWSNQARARKREVKRLWQDRLALQKDVEAQADHIYDLRRILSQHGIARPPLPDLAYRTLEDDDEDDDI